MGTRQNKNLIKLIGSICIVLILAALPFTELCAQSTPHPIVRINLLTSKMGGSGYTMSFAMADIVNKNHPWLRVTAIETTGITENLRLMIEEPQRRSNTIFYCAGPDSFMAQQGFKPYPKRYNGMRGIAQFGAVGWFFLTLDPNIKTPRDFVGRRVELGPPGSIALFPELILKHGWGITSDKVKFLYAPPAVSPGHLADKLIDVTFSIGFYPPPEYRPIPAVAELMALKKVYFIGMGKEAMENMIKVTGYHALAGYISSVPGGSFGPMQPNDMDCFTEYIGWYADAEMDEGIIFQLTKTIYENTEKFAEYHAVGKGVTKGTIAALHIPENEWHSGALKFYKEKGVQIK